MTQKRSRRMWPLVLGTGAALVLLGVMKGFADHVPASPAEAAADAARCLGWPDTVAAAAEANFTGRKVSDPPMVLAFKHAKAVEVSAFGQCGVIQDLSLVSEPLRHLPPMARVNGGKQDYILLYTGSPNGRDFVFIGVRAGTTGMVIGPPQNPGSI